MQQHSTGTSSSCALSSPEPGFPKRRPHAVRLAVVPPEDAAEGGGLPQSYNASPTPLSARTPRARAGGGFSSSSKQQQGGHSSAGGCRDPAKQAVQVVLVLMLLAAAGSAGVLVKHRLAQATHQRERFQAELALQVEWLAASMAEHRQCKMALERADAEFVTAQQSLQLCRGRATQQPGGAASAAASHPQQPALLSSAAAAAASPAGTAAADSNLPWLLHELEAARKALQETKLALATAEGQLAALQASTQQGAACMAATKALADSQAKLQAEQEAARQLTARLQQTEAELDDATQLLEEHDQEQLAAMVAAASPSGPGRRRPQTHPQPATPGPPAGHAPASVSRASASAAARTVILVACDAADARAGVMQPWGEAAALASLPHVMVVTQHEGCEAAAAEAGLKVFKHAFKLPAALDSPGAAGSAAAYRRYAALKQVLELGHPALSVKPHVLLLSNPLPLLQHYPTDVAVVSASATGADADDDLAYGRLLPVPAAHRTGRTAAALFSTHPVSTALLHVRPSAATLQLVEGVMSGLAAGHRSEGALLNELLLTLWHLPASSSSSSSSAAATPDGHFGGAPLPLTVGVLPVERFVSSSALPGEADMQAWLQAHAPIAVRVEATGQAAADEDADVDAAAAGGEEEGAPSAHGPDALMEDILVHFWAGQPDHAVGHMEPPPAGADHQGDDAHHHHDGAVGSGGGSGSSEPGPESRSRHQLEQQEQEQHAPPPVRSNDASELRQQQQEQEERRHRAWQQAEEHRSQRRQPQQQQQARDEDAGFAQGD